MTTAKKGKHQELLKTWRRRKPVHCPWECEMVWLLWKTLQYFLKELKRELLYDPAIPLLGRHSKEVKAGSQRDTCSPSLQQCYSQSPREEGSNPKVHNGCADKHTVGCVCACVCACTRGPFTFTMKEVLTHALAQRKARGRYAKWNKLVTRQQNCMQSIMPHTQRSHTDRRKVGW